MKRMSGRKTAELWNRRWKGAGAESLYSEAGFRLIEPSIPDGLILDLGCGSGSNTARIMHSSAKGSAGRSVIALDISDAAVRKAHGTGALGVVADIGNLPFRDNVFNGVLSMSSLEYSTDPKQSFSEAARILRPGGVLMATLPTQLSPFSLLRRVRVWLGRYPDIQRHYSPGYVRSLTGALAEKMMSGYGLFIQFPLDRVLEKSSILRRLAFAAERFMPRFILSNFGYHLVFVGCKANGDKV
ncbi:MAG: class I SAM-dependent methyltransferase [archaeon]